MYIPSDEIANRPENSHTAQDTPRCKQQESEESCGVHGHITTNSQAEAGKQGADTVTISATGRTQAVRVEVDIRNPAIATISSQTERAAEQQRHVEHQTTPNGVRSKIPEGGSHNQTHEEKAGRESDLRFRDAEFAG